MINLISLEVFTRSMSTSLKWGAHSHLYCHHKLFIKSNFLESFWSLIDIFIISIFLVVFSFLFPFLHVTTDLSSFTAPCFPQFSLHFHDEKSFSFAVVSWLTSWVHTTLNADRPPMKMDFSFVYCLNSSFPGKYVRSLLFLKLLFFQKLQLSLSSSSLFMESFLLSEIFQNRTRGKTYEISRGKPSTIDECYRNNRTMTTKEKPAQKKGKNLQTSLHVRYNSWWLFLPFLSVIFEKQIFRLSNFCATQK